MIKILTDTCDNFKQTNVEKENSQKLDAILNLLKQVADYMFPVNTLCTETKDKELLELDSDTEIVSDADKSLHKDTDKNKSSPSMLDSRPLRKRSRLALYPVKNATVIENSATTLVNNISEISEDEVIEASPTQRSVASKLRQFLELKRKIPKKCIDFRLCPSPKHTSTQMENINTLKDKINISYLSPIKMHNKTDIKDKTFYLPAEQTANKNEMDNFNLDDIENKPHKKKMLLDKFNVWSKRKDISEQLNMRCKADRAKLNGWDCWECREYYNNLSLSKKELKKRKNRCSRHRRKYERPNTPEDFWDPVFPETLSTY
ncbi:uncharacterized protein [Temnothorax nylanderi]|uniref:uncharacterized protein n=1 Tax=Temnothorax nylanderi TaxID=102681 RepID=UPI003A86321E